MDQSQRIPYSPESLSSEYPYSGGQDTSRTLKVVVGSPEQKFYGPQPAGVYDTNEPAETTPYLPATFHIEREPACKS